MDDAVGVGEVDGVADPGQRLQQPTGRRRVVDVLGEHAREGPPAHPHHRQREAAVAVVPEVMHRDDGGMLEPPLHLCLPEEARPGGGVGGQPGQQRLDRHIAPEALVAKEAHLAHATPTEDLAATEAGREGTVTERRRRRR